MSRFIANQSRFPVAEEDNELGFPLHADTRAIDVSPARLRKQAEKALDKYGSIEPDLSHLTDEQLRGMRELLEPGKVAAPMAADTHCDGTLDSEPAQLAWSDPSDQSD